MISVCIPLHLYVLVGVYFKSMFSQLLTCFVCQNVFISQSVVWLKIVLFLNWVFLCGVNENGLNQSDGCFIEKDLQ